MHKSERIFPFCAKIQKTSCIPRVPSTDAFPVSQVLRPGAAEVLPATQPSRESSVCLASGLVAAVSKSQVQMREHKPASEQYVVLLEAGSTARKDKPAAALPRPLQ